MCGCFEIVVFYDLGSLGLQFLNGEFIVVFGDVGLFCCSGFLFKCVVVIREVVEFLDYFVVSFGVKQVFIIVQLFFYQMYIVFLIVEVFGVQQWCVKELMCWYIDVYVLIFVDCDFGYSVGCEVRGKSFVCVMKYIV